MLNLYFLRTFLNKFQAIHRCLGEDNAHGKNAFLKMRRLYLNLLFIILFTPINIKNDGIWITSYRIVNYCVVFLIIRFSIGGVISTVTMIVMTNAVNVF